MGRVEEMIALRMIRNYSCILKVPPLTVSINTLIEKSSCVEKNFFDTKRFFYECIVRNITLLGPSNRWPRRWHQDLEFGPRMDIFGSLLP